MTATMKEAENQSNPRLSSRVGPDLSRRLDGIGEYYFSQKLREIDLLNKAGKNIINLGIGSPDLPPHSNVIDVLHAESRKPTTHAYQNYKGSPILRSAIARWYEQWYGVKLNPESEILPLIGSKEGIMHICMTYLQEGSPVLVPNPGYPTYRSAAKLAGGTLLDYDLQEANHWLPDFQQLLELVHRCQVGKGKKGALLLVNYPHMPTGQIPTLELFERLVAFAKDNNVLLVHDNPYSFILNRVPMSLLQVDGAMDVAIELNSLSKSHNMAGWRVGMLLGAAERIEEVLRFKSNMDSGMFLPVQLAAAKALELPASWYEDLNEVYTKRRTFVFELLEVLECSFDPSQVGMFVWAKVPAKFQTGYALSDEVLERARVFITPGGIFGQGGNNFVRVSLCCPEEKLKESLIRIKTALNSKS